MIPSLTGLLTPVSTLVPPAIAFSAHPLNTLLADAHLVDAVSALPRLAETALGGGAGTAIASTLAEAEYGTKELLLLSTEVERLAGDGASALSRATEDITAIARQCSRELIALVTSSPPHIGTAVTAAQITWNSLERAAQRLLVLESELNTLASQIERAGISCPSAPQLSAFQEGSATSGERWEQEDTNEPSGISSVALETNGIISVPSPEAKQAVLAAKSALGTPYLWGGTEPGAGMDCSGLTQWAYSQAGVDLPRTAEAQAVGPRIPMDQLAPGDLAVWDGHVAMVSGDGMMIEAGDPVQMSPIRTDNIGMTFHGFYRPTAGEH